MFHFNHIIAYHWYRAYTLLDSATRYHHAQGYIWYVALNDQIEDDLWYRDLEARIY